MVALIGGAVVLLLVAVIGAILLFRGDGEEPMANPTPSISMSDTPSASPTPDLPDPESLDSAATDQTSLTTDAIFPDRTFTGDNGETYSLAGTLKTSACSGVGGDPVKRLLRKYDCGRMVVGVWLNADQDLFSALLVIPLQNDEDAEALHSDIVADKQDVINGMTYYCPSDGKPGAKLCKRGADNLPTWYASFTTFHRYLFVAVSLYTDGHRAQSMSEVDDFTAQTVSYVSNVMLGED